MEAESTKVGIMQPYFFPYIGYFQLIQAVDEYVNLDHVSFIKRGYMTRNIIKGDTNIHMPVSGGTQNSYCDEVGVIFEDRHLQKLLKTIKHLYKKSNRYDEIMELIIIPSFDNNKLTISQFNIRSIKLICELLNIDTIIHATSRTFGVDHLKSANMLKGITTQLGGNIYINAIGGRKLYAKEDFAADGIDIRFLKMGDVDFSDPYASIIHQLFCYSDDHIMEQLENYELL